MFLFEGIAIRLLCQFKHLAIEVKGQQQCHAIYIFLCFFFPNIKIHASLDLNNVNYVALAQSPPLMCVVDTECFTST